jgi:nitrite reductase (NADH) large subunit
MEFTAKERLVVVGNGMAAGRALEELLERAPGRYDITVLGAEPRVNYNRIMLSPVLSGEKTFEQIVTHDEAWYETNRITLMRGARATGIDRTARTVALESGETLPYDKLLIATGSLPIVIPVPGHTLPGVIGFRDLDDVDRMLAASANGGNAVVIGGGLLGLEAAAGLRSRGMKVTVLHLMPTLMERQLDPAAGYLLEKALTARGIDIITRANTKEIIGDGKVEAVRLDDSREIPASLVVMAVGIRPSTALAASAGLEVGRGVKVDDRMFTSDRDILAVGECVEHRGTCYGLVAPLYDMARVVAEQLTENGEAAYSGSQTSTKLKVTGIDLFSAGDFAEGNDREEIVFRDAARGVYKRLVLRDGRIIGAVMYGDTADGAWFFQLLREGRDISDQRDTLIFGQGYAGSAKLDPTAAVAALPPEAEICGCNGVCKGKIVDTITTKKLTSLDEVRAHTKASSSCGTCTGLVEQLMSLTLGEGFQRETRTPMCSCTDLGHDDVRRLIVGSELKSMPAVMQDLGWKTSCGCAKCRPALNYYLLASWPGEYLDDQQSRFINERVHANIQKDGTYSVVPRMWGGVTTAQELRAIADAAEKYDIRTIKVTGGQRIDLLGVRKEDLPNIWRDLNAAGMVSGHAYGKALRTVKTCVGSEWCRFGTQDSTGLGIALERLTWGSWTPAKVKLGVSGCPRNCAEATVKDIGVICVESGFELHVSGAAGLHVKATELLCKVPTQEDVLEYTGAIIQLYREQARYLERIWKWTDRVGLDHVRQQVTDDSRRRILFQRFIHAQKFAQVDPWAERTGGDYAAEFEPVADLGLAGVV